MEKIQLYIMTNLTDIIAIKDRTLERIGLKSGKKSLIFGK